MYVENPRSKKINNSYQQRGVVYKTAFWADEVRTQVSHSRHWECWSTGVGKREQCKGLSKQSECYTKGFILYHEYTWQNNDRTSV